MSFFKKIGKAIGKVGKAVGSIVGKVVKTVAPVAAIIPGVGGIVAAGASVVGNLLSPEKQNSIEQAVARDGEVKLEKIEETIYSHNPTLNTTTLQQATLEMANKALNTTPTATINDSNSISSVSFGTKALQWLRKNVMFVGLGLLGFLMLNNDKKGYSRRKKRY